MRRFNEDISFKLAILSSLGEQHSFNTESHLEALRFIDRYKHESRTSIMIIQIEDNLDAATKLMEFLAFKS